MSTRFYFGLLDIPNISPAFSGNWEQTPTIGTFTRGTLKPYPEGIARDQQASIATKTSATTPWDNAGGQFISKPLAQGGTLSGTFDVVIQTLEGPDGTIDAMLQVVIRVVDGPGTTVRGTAYAGQTNTTVVTTSGAQNQEVGVTPNAAIRYWSSIALTNVTYQAGDRIVVEIGMRQLINTATGSGNLKISDAADIIPVDARGDLIKGAATIIGSGTYPGYPRPYIEFSQDLYPTLNAEEFRFYDDGIVLNSGATVPFVDVTSVEGLDSTEPRLQTHDREGVHGGYASSQFETLRTITLEGLVYATPTALEAYLDSLKANYAPTPSDKKFFFGTDAGMRFCWGKSQGIRYGKTSQRGSGVVPFQVQVVCQDPRIYAPAEVSVSGVATNAISPAWTQLNNTGNRDTPVLIKIFGPTESGLFMYLQNAYGTFNINYTGTALAADDILVIDTDKRTVVRNYYTNVRGDSVSTFTAGSQWVNLQPGTNLLRGLHNGTPFNWTATCRPAWR